MPTTVNTFQYPMQSGPQNNRTITRTKELPRRKKCIVPLLTDPCCGFNYTRCQADTEYFQPYCVKADPPIPDVTDESNCVGLSSKFTFTLSSIAIGEKIVLPLIIGEDCTVAPSYTAVSSVVIDELAGYLAFVQATIGFLNPTGVITLNTLELSLDFTGYSAEYADSCSKTLRVCILDALDVPIDGRVTYKIPSGIGGRSICCAAESCDIPEGYMQFMITVENIIPPNERIIIGFGCESKGCSMDTVINSYELPTNGYSTIPELVGLIAAGLSNNHIATTINGNSIIVQLLESYFQTPSEFADCVYCGASMMICAFDANTMLPYTDEPLFTWFGEDGVRGMTLECCPYKEEVVNDCVRSVTSCPPCGVSDNYGCAETDLLYFQFQFPDEFNDYVNGNYTYGWRPDKTGNWLATVEVESPFCCSATYSQFVKHSLVGWLKDNDKTYQQIIIDPTLMPPIFWLKFSFNLGLGQIKCVYSEPYKRISCEPTFTIEGEYPLTGQYSIDCDSNYYGLFTTTDGENFPYSNIKRVHGSLEYDGYTIERETLNNRTIKIVNGEKWLLRTAKIPPYVNDQIRLALQGNVAYINGRPFLFAGDVDKNMEVGSMWLLNLKLSRVDEECYIKYFNCT